MKQTRSRIDRQRARLEQALESLLRRTAKVERDLAREAGPLSADSEDRAVELENEEVLQGLEAEGHDQIALIREALARMDQGTWGTCADCRRPIAEARLEALPAATTCIDCARTRER